MDSVILQKYPPSKNGLGKYHGAGAGLQPHALRSRVWRQGAGAAGCLGVRAWTALSYDMKVIRSTIITREPD